MARRGILLLASIAWIGGSVRDAAAGVTVDLVFTKHNGSPVSTSTITALPGDTLEMAVLFRNDVPITGFGVSLDFDAGPKDELDVFYVFQWSGMLLNANKSTQVFAPVISMEPPSDPGALGTGRIQSFHSVDGPWFNGTPLPAGGTYQIGTVSWVVTENVATNGPDIVSGFLKLGFDGLLDAAYLGADSLVRFNAATVNGVAPVPSLSDAGAAAVVSLILGAAFWAFARARR